MSRRLYQCPICGFPYDPNVGDSYSNIEPGTEFKNLPDEWLCPVCFTTKNLFEEEEEE